MKSKQALRETGRGRMPAMAAAFVLGSVLACAAGERLPALLLSPKALASLDPALLALIFLSGFFPAGAAAVVAGFAAKGFLLSAEAARVLQGTVTGASALLPLFLPAFLSLTALVLLGRQSLELAGERLRARGRSRRIFPDTAYFVTAGAGLLLLFLSGALRLRG